MLTRRQPRIEGKVEIRPSAGFTAPFKVSFVKIALQRRETVHPAADNIKKHLAAPRKEITEIVGTELLLYRCSAGTEYDSLLIADLPFVIFIPYGRGGEEHIAKRVPPGSVQLPSRTAETFYELLVTVQQGQSEQKKFASPIPITRYDTLSTFGMYNRTESAEQISDHIVTLGISLPRWSFGPSDPVSVSIKLAPNPDLLSKSRKVTVKTITISIDEEIIFNHEGDEPQKKVKSLAKQAQTVGLKMPEAGYLTNLGLVFPSKNPKNADGFIARDKKEVPFPMYSVGAFTTTGGLYKIQYYLTVKVSFPFIPHHADNAGLFIRRERHYSQETDCRMSLRSCLLQRIGIVH
jgi:Arrestin (or S-antigen), C-terminal domain